MSSAVFTTMGSLKLIFFYKVLAQKELNFREENNITLYHVISLFIQVVQNEENENCLKKVDPQLLKMALTPYPKLKAALFPQYTVPSVLPPDITLYHLIQVQQLGGGCLGISITLQLDKQKPHWVFQVENI